MKLYFSARIVSLVDEAVTEDVDRIGPITRWERRDSGKVVLYTSYRGKEVEYHVEKGKFSEAYDKIINKPEPRNVDPKLRAVLGSFGQFLWKSEKPAESKPSPTVIKFTQRSHSPARVTGKQIKVSSRSDLSESSLRHCLLYPPRDPMRKMILSMRGKLGGCGGLPPVCSGATEDLDQ